MHCKVFVCLSWWWWWWSFWVLTVGILVWNENFPTCHQQLYSTLAWHLLWRVAGDEVKHICSTVRRSHIRNPQRTVFSSWSSQVLHPVLVRWIWKDTSAVEDISEERDRLRSSVHLNYVSSLFKWVTGLVLSIYWCGWNNTLAWYSGCFPDTTSQIKLCTVVLLLFLHPNKKKTKNKTNDRG